MDDLNKLLENAGMDMVTERADANWHKMLDLHAEGINTIKILGASYLVNEALKNSDWDGEVDDAEILDIQYNNDGGIVLQIKIYEAMTDPNQVKIVVTGKSIRGAW